MRSCLLLLLSVILPSSIIHCLPEQTKWPDQPIDFKSSANTQAFLHAVLANDTKVKLQINCEQKAEPVLEFEVRWLLRYSECAGIYHLIKEEDACNLITQPETLFSNEEYSDVIAPGLTAHESYVSSYRFKCGEPIELADLTNQNWMRVNTEVTKQAGSNDKENDKKAERVEQPSAKEKSKDVGKKASETPAVGTQRRQRRQNEPKNTKLESVLNNMIYKTRKSGPFMLVIEIVSLNASLAKTVEAKGTYAVEFVGPNGYLSALDYPMLGFSGVLCAVYGIFSFVWIVFGAIHWKDLLRVQFWIGAVIGMGLIEQAVFLGEYEQVNRTGLLYQWAEMTAEFISILKRTLARCLVLIVSLGYGLVKPRLGSLMNNVVGVCLCYFIFATVEAGLRIFQRRNDPSTKALIAAIPLSVTESIICWWVFTSLMATLKNLKLRRNIVKLTVYRHFFNTLIFCVVAAIIFMLWSIRMHRMPDCVTDWRELWIDDAYWQLLFCVILFVIVILWRPSQNNKRYAFSPLMDHEDEEQEEPFIDTENSNFDQVKIRKNVSNYDKNINRTADKKEDDHLKWVEENIPTAGFDTALPSLLDSDEEVMTTKLEMSKQL